jgi:hypothetical protein
MFVGALTFDTHQANLSIILTGVHYESGNLADHPRDPDIDGHSADVVPRQPLERWTPGMLGIIARVVLDRILMGHP